MLSHTLIIIHNIHDQWVAVTRNRSHSSIQNMDAIVETGHRICEVVVSNGSLCSQSLQYV